MERVMNKQFEIAGLKVKFENIPDSGEVDVAGKKWKWYNLYKLTEEEEEKWREWAVEEMEKVMDKDKVDKLLRKYELLYGLVRKYKKKGELF